MIPFQEKYLEAYLGRILGTPLINKPHDVLMPIAAPTIQSIQLPPSHSDIHLYGTNTRHVLTNVKYFRRAHLMFQYIIFQLLYHSIYKIMR